MLIVAIQHRDNRLYNNRPGVEVFVDEVNRATGELHTVLEGLPLRFEVNEGQADPSVQFIGRGSAFDVYLSSTTASFVLPSSDTLALPAAERLLG